MTSVLAMSSTMRGALGGAMTCVMVVDVVGIVDVRMRIDPAVGGCRQRRRSLRQPLTLPGMHIGVMSRGISHESASSASPRPAAASESSVTVRVSVINLRRQYSRSGWGKSGASR